ncbi:hypothetical protein BGW38_003286 [Lunasporangiospora selenospora]|uniref:Signal transduction histidine kinase n=1 Tax=Lunasporangiospora selenospora TaxID=979761 RepID=A0A9P6FSW8_9FUNG|nr:hypothetical protein BGW38_003286 [Lunasporangiospora selenospora]
MEQEWRDPCFPFLAPIAATLLTCNGDSFFDVVVEELANSLGVKYAFVSQLVTLEELKDLDPPEYMSIVERFHGDIPPIDGVMHNISSWPGEPHIDPHAFQSYLTDCTIEDRITCVHSDLAHLHPDITEALSDPSVESYLSVRLETAQGEIVGVIGVIHSKPLDGESAMIVRRVLEHVGIRVADELDRLRMEANLVFARDTAESTAKNKTKFLADMSHEIRNPMNAVVGVTDILLDTEGLSDEQTGFIEVIRTSGQHLLTVINDILDISRIDQDVKFLLEKRPLSLRKCLKDAVSLAGLTPLHDVSKTIAVIEWPAELDDMQYCDHTGESTELPLLWTIDENVPEHLLGDITRLRQVLINLCTNSLKFTQRGRVSVRVSIHNPSQGNNPTIHPVSSPTAMRHFPTGSTVGTDHGHGLGQSQAQVLSHNHGQSHSLGHEIGEIGATRSWPASPMLTGQDHRQPMVFEQRYDVKIDSPTAPTPLKPVPSSRRRNGLGGESYGTHSRGRLSQSAPIPFPDAPEGYSSSTSSNTNSNTASPMIVAAPTANSMDKSKMDENTVILEFAVSDTGVGIPANKLADLFTSFSQVDISVSTRFGGTGLGLAISASLVEKMGGHIWVESTEGVGSRFTFTIPFAVCPSPDTESYPCSTAPSSPVTAPDSSEISSAPSIEPVQLPPVASRKSLRPTSSSFPSSLTSNGLTASPAPTPAPVPAPSSAPVSGPESGSKKDKKSKKETKGKKPLSIKSMGPRPTKESAVSKSLGPSYAKVVESNPVEPVTINDRPLRILLAEDNFVNQKVAVGVLKKLGYENVEVVDNGLRVIEKLDRGAVYDVILMDVSMPVMDGIDATKTIVNRRTRGLLYNSALAGGLPSESLEASGAASSSSGTERGHPAPPSIPTEGMVNSILPHPFQDYSNVYVIALTASAMGSDKERCILAGMDDFMTKPFAALEMKRVLAEFKSRLESGALQTRNEACLAAAVTAARNRCRSPTCQGNSSSGHSSEQEQNRAGTPLIPSALSSSSSTTSLVDIATGSSLPANGCQNCGGGAQENAGLSTGPISSGSPSLTAHRPSRLEAPWPIRKVDAASCGFIFGRRANSESVYAINGGATLDCSMNSAVFRRASENLCANGKWMDGAVVAGRGLGYQPSSITTVVVEDVQPEGRANVHPLESVLASLHMNKSLKSLKSDAETGLTSGAADVECKSTKPRSETEPSKDFGVTKGALLSPPPSASSATTSSSVLAASASLMSTNGTTTTKDLSAQGVNSEVVTMTAVPAATKSASLSSSSGSVSVSGPSSVSPPAAAAVAPVNGASSPVIPPPLTPPPNAMVYIKSIKRDLGMDNCMRFPTAL